MDNIRNGNLGVEKMRREILESIEVLKTAPMSKRTERQLIDGDKFIKMIDTYPYYLCKTVSGLIKKIIYEREKTKYILSKTDKYSLNHQVTIFDTYEEIGEDEEKRILYERERLEEEIKWLHKCLGMCISRDYFK